MTTFTVQVPENIEGEFLKFLESFKGIKISNRKELTNKFRNEIKDTLKEVELLEKGIIKKVKAADFLAELENG